MRMFVLEDNLYGFKIRQTWFAQRPEDVKGVAMAMFYFCKDALAQAPVGFEKGNTSFNVIDIDKPIADVLKSFHRNTRYCISQAAKQNPEVRINQDYDGFVSLRAAFFKEKKLLLPHRVTAEQLKQSPHILATVHYDGKLIDGHYFAVDEDFANMIFSCSVRLHDAVNAKLIGDCSRYAIYKSMEAAQRMGVKRFSLGAIGGKKGVDGVGGFKESFGGTRAQMPYYTKTYSRALRALNLARKIIS
jgi:hypothetical protein